MSVLVAATAAACGDDEKKGGGGGSGGTGGSAGTAGSGASGGTGGTGGSSGSGGSAGTGATGGSAGMSGSAGMAGSAGAAGTDGGIDLVARGAYLVNHVAVCPDCHTPRNPDGSLDATMFLAGTPFADIDPGDDTKGMVYARNITQDMTTGIGAWTDAEIKDAFLNGNSKRAGALFPMMPYYVLYNMTAQDADAIVAYLRTVPAIDNDVPARQDLGFPFTTPAMPVPEAAIPKTTLATTDPNYDSAVRGRYLAGQIGVCMECHTEDSAPGSMVPIDTTKLFQGNKSFPAALIGVPSPPFPAEIFTRNLTPHANGLQGWTALAVRNALKDGIDKDGVPLCPPMPAGPMAAFGGLTDEDATDIGNFLTTLAPADNGVIPNCTPPGPPPDGGAAGASGDASTDSSASDAPAD